MSFDEDSRWDEVIALMNYLSINKWTGMTWFKLVDGRVSRRTVEQLQLAKRQVDMTLPQREEAAHG